MAPETLGAAGLAAALMLGALVLARGFLAPFPILGAVVGSILVAVMFGVGCALALAILRNRLKA